MIDSALLAGKRLTVRCWEGERKEAAVLGGLFFLIVTIVVIVTIVFSFLVNNVGRVGVI